MSENTHPYTYSKLPKDTLVEDLINRMDIEERVTPMLNLRDQECSFLLDDYGNLIPENLNFQFNQGVSQIASFSDSGIGLNPGKIPQTTRLIMEYLVEDICPVLELGETTVKVFNRIHPKKGEAKAPKFEISSEHSAYTCIDKEFVDGHDDLEIMLESSPLDSEIKKHSYK